MRKKENKITVLSRPVNLAFELNPDKAEEFFKVKNTVQKAIERSERHTCKVANEI